MRGDSLSLPQRSRYARHIALSEIGEQGQLKLLRARALIVGLGGLGSPAAMYLAAAGVGTLGLVDDDVVESSNLQRQLLHTQARIGQLKVDSAELALRALREDMVLHKYAIRFDRDNAEAIVANYDVVIDASDNFPTRYLLNDTCYFARKPLIYGAIHRFDGQIAVFERDAGPCYRCLYPRAPLQEDSISSSGGGVIGALPGIIGAAQAMETIKMILGVGEPLRARLLTFDALQMRFRTLNIRRDPECPLCGDDQRAKEQVEDERD